MSFLKSPLFFLSIFENSDFLVTKYDVFSTITSRILKEEFIHTPQDAIDKLEAGASLLQIYTGFVYEGPGMVKSILKTL